MVEEFTLQYRAQQEWGWLAVLDFFLAGGGAGLYLIGMALGISLALPVGLAAALIGALLLLADLGHPERFWRAISRPGSSWISRGVILVAIFLVFGTASIALPATSDGGIRIVAGVIAAIAAMGVMAYTGFLLADSPGVPAWHSALVPVQFVVFSLLTGIGELYLLLPALNSGETARVDVLEAVGLGLGLGTLLMLTAYLVALRSSGPAARQAQYELIRGRFTLPFLGGGILLGVVVPMADLTYLFLAGHSLAGANTPLALAGVLIIFGGLLIRYSLLKVGFYEPVIERIGTNAA